jgi:hypothetical protein
MSRRTRRAARRRLVLWIAGNVTALTVLTLWLVTRSFVSSPEVSANPQTQREVAPLSASVSPAPPPVS